MDLDVCMYVCLYAHVWGTCVSVYLCVSKDEGAEGHGVRACLTCSLVGWLDAWFAMYMPDWVQPSSSLATLALWVSLSLPGVTGWDIKTGVLINSASLPPAALNMLRPWQAVSQTTDSPALLLFNISQLCIIFYFFLLLPFQFENLHHIQFTSLTSLCIWSCIPAQFDPYM